MAPKDYLGAAVWAPIVLVLSAASLNIFKLALSKVKELAHPETKLPAEELRAIAKQLSSVLNDRLFPFAVKIDFNNVMLMAVVISAIALMTSLGDVAQRQSTEARSETRTHQWLHWKALQISQCKALSHCIFIIHTRAAAAAAVAACMRLAVCERFKLQAVVDACSVYTFASQ